MKTCKCGKQYDPQTSRFKSRAFLCEDCARAYYRDYQRNRTKSLRPDRETAGPGHAQPVYVVGIDPAVTDAEMRWLLSAYKHSTFIWSDFETTMRDCGFDGLRVRYGQAEYFVRGGQMVEATA